MNIILGNKKNEIFKIKNLVLNHDKTIYSHIIVNNTSIAKTYTSEFNQMFEHKSWHKKKADNNDENF